MAAYETGNPKVPFFETFEAHHGFCSYCGELAVDSGSGVLEYRDDHPWEIEDTATGWFYWFVPTPGGKPYSEPCGPFKTEAAAVDAARTAAT
jgi:hypothetical protein